MTISRRFPGKRVLITGAGSGLGRALALEFARRGWKIGIAEILEDRARESETLVAREGGTGLTIPCDVARHEQVEAAVETVQATWGGLDILVNNAGVLAAGYFDEIPLDAWERIIDVNQMSMIYGCRAAIPVFKRQRSGYLVNVASSAGIVSLPETGSYNMTKAAVISISETLRTELAAFDVGVSVVCPTFFKTNLMERFTAPDERHRRFIDAMFSRSTVTAQQVAQRIIESIEDNRLYVIPQIDGRLLWWAKRAVPELYFRLLAFAYRRVRVMGIG